MENKTLLKKYKVQAVGQGKKRVGGEKTDKDSTIFFVKRKKKDFLSKLILKISGNLIPKKVDGKETDVIEIGDIKTLDAYRSKHRPIKAGVSMCNAYSTACTSGIPIWLGKWKALVNRHCGERINRAEPIKGDPMIQPSLFDGGDMTDTAGIVEDWYRVDPEKDDNLMDSLIVDLKVDMVPELVKESYDPEIDNVLPGDIVWKEGRTTGYTEGEVLATNVAVAVRGMHHVINYVGQILTEPILEGGDSSSVGFRKDNKKIFGQGFAGSDRASVFTPMQIIKDHFGFSFKEENDREGWIALGWWTRHNRLKIELDYNARLRKEPGLKAEQIGTILEGEEVELADNNIVEKDEYKWVKINR